MANFAIDLAPLRKSKDFSLLWAAGLISYFGSMITYVAVPFQIKELTDSYVAVAISGLVEIVPLVIFGLYGGVLADALDRKKLIWVTEALSLLFTGILLINSMMDSPNLLLIYIVSGLFAAVSGLRQPAMQAALPRLVDHEDMTAAAALMSLRWQVGVIVGPAIGGILISSYSVAVGYAADIATFIISIALIAFMKKIPPTHEAEAPSLSALIDGVKYAFSRKDLLGTYLIDLAAMFFAMPTALIPFWADQLGAPWALGLLYAAGTIGSIAITLTSGWTKNVHFYGRAIMWAAIGWGVAIALSGVTNYLWLVLLFLTLAGASDMISALFRSAMWNQTIPDNLRGRLAGIELLSYSLGPLAGQMRAASMAAVTTLSISVTSGGIICVIAVVLLASFLPDFRNFDIRTNKFALENQKMAEKLRVNPQSGDEN
ncbi:MAG: MFS transporter [Candidatus Planktophila sp.]|nr:MFS transporter [Candidatus Planktophila sp.]